MMHSESLKCTGKIEPKYRCFYCSKTTTQAPVFACLIELFTTAFLNEERIYPSCCYKCADDGLWRDIAITDASKEIVAQARALPACPLAKTTDHRCSVRAAMIQAAYDVVCGHEKWKRPESS